MHSSHNNVLQNNLKLFLNNIKLPYNDIYNIATINITTLKESQTREHVQKWMKETNIMITALQETKTPHNGKEQKQHYTWFFS